MKYKIYPVVFILVVLSFMTVFGGILQVEGDYYHKESHFHDFKYFSNNLSASLEVTVALGCYDRVSDCNKDYLGPDHYTCVTTIKKFDTVVETIVDSLVNVRENNELADILTNVEFGAIGDYTATYTITCEDGTVSEDVFPFTVIEGIHGEYDVETIQLVCGENNSTFTYTSEHFNGENHLSLQGTTGSLSLNVAADIAVTNYPCLEDSYSFNESGSFTVTENELTISYTDGAATASRSFQYQESQDQLVLAHSDSDTGDAIYITLNKVAELASK